jgi:hypothetical protein
MTTEDLTLSEVMYSVGIQTQSYFTKACKKMSLVKRRRNFSKICIGKTSFL